MMIASTMTAEQALELHRESGYYDFENFLKWLAHMKGVDTRDGYLGMRKPPPLFTCPAHRALVEQAMGGETPELWWDVLPADCSKWLAKVTKIGAEYSSCSEVTMRPEVDYWTGDGSKVFTVRTEKREDGTEVRVLVPGPDTQVLREVSSFSHPARNYALYRSGNILHLVHVQDMAGEGPGLADMHYEMVVAAWGQSA